MLDEILSDAKTDMNKVIEVLKKQLASIRTGRANISLLDGVKVDFYGAMSPISQVANMLVLDPSMLAVKPWDKSMLKPIEKAIMEANLGLMPVVDGDMVRLPIPPLTEERRREFVKQAKQKCEDAKIAVRNVRRDSNEMLKESTKEGTITEDDEKRGLKDIQTLTDQIISDLDKHFAHKEIEIMQV
ncbi:MAG: ribosome recycling factor [bacterium]|nr:ribosome recycling factor [bacterium]